MYERNKPYLALICLSSNRRSVVQQRLTPVSNVTSQIMHILLASVWLLSCDFCPGVRFCSLSLSADTLKLQRTNTRFARLSTSLCYLAESPSPPHVRPSVRPTIPRSIRRLIDGGSDPLPSAAMGGDSRPRTHAPTAGVPIDPPRWSWPYISVRGDTPTPTRRSSRHAQVSVHPACASERRTLMHRLGRSDAARVCTYVSLRQACAGLRPLVRPCESSQSQSQSQPRSC